MKTCTNCRVEKSMEMFSAHPAAADGRQSQCKECFAERARRKRQGRPCIHCAQPLPVGSPYRARACDACLATCRTCKSAPRAGSAKNCTACQAVIDKQRKGSDEAKFKERITRIASNFKVRRGLAAVLAAQTHCEACGKKCERSGELHVDHCHTSGEVRGVLCFNCNAALGHIGDSLDRLRKLTIYLERTTETKSQADLEKARHFIDLLIDLESRRDDGK